MINRVVLVGRLTRDAETMTGARGPVVRMRMRTTSAWRDGDGNRREAAEYHNLVAYSKLAEACGAYERGCLLYAEGRLRTREYDGSDGLRRMSTDIIVDTIRMLAGHDNDELTAAVLSYQRPGGRERAVHVDEGKL